MTQQLETSDTRLASAPCPAELLRCPVTGQPLSWLGLRGLEQLNRELTNGSVRHQDGTPVQGPIDGVYATSDGCFRYAVREQIVLLLPELAIVASQQCHESLRSEKHAVQKFYDEVGWVLDQRGVFADCDRFEDQRSVSADYIRRCHQRLARHLPRRGRFLLDVASGPIQYPEYLEYSQGFDYRVCVDLSFAALQAARRNIGRQGIYILGDITNLPLQDGCVDAAVSLHTIYHVPADEQATAFREVSRVVREGAPAIVVYNWKSPWIRLLKVPRRVVSGLRRAAAAVGSVFRAALGRGSGAKSPLSHRQVDSAQDGPQLYFHAHSHRWFARQAWPFEFQVFCWRSISVDLMKFYIHRGLAGRRLLSWLYRLEEACPHVLGRCGAYPLLVLRRSSSQAGQVERARAA
jgi:ubiquinone/menaquinone biosynthesis C-methylase UbiE